MEFAEGFKGAKVLIVGGAGFVGSNLAHSLVEAGVGSLIIVDNLLSADASNVPDADCVTFYPYSINDDRVLNALPKDLDYAYHLATFHGNQSSLNDPLTDHEHNTLTSLKLFNHLRNYDLKKLVYASAGCTVAQKTFDGAVATTEDDPVSLYLDSPYQMSKIFGEFYGNFYHLRHGLPFVKARFQNVYGPREILGAGRWRGTANTIFRNVTPTFIYKALNHEALPVENGGIASRDFIYAEDMAKGLRACALHGESGGVYNLASGAETTILQLAEKINEMTGNPTPIDYKPPRDWDRSGQRFADTSKSEKELGFTAGTDIDAGLERTVRWTRDNWDVIQRCVAQHQPMLKFADRIAI